MRTCPSCRLPVTQTEWRCDSCGWSSVRTHGIIVLGTEARDPTDGFSPDHFAELARLEAGHFWFRARNRIILWAADKYLPGARTFLEVGCGTGFVLQALHAHRPDIQMTGSELFMEGLAVAERRLPGVELLQLDAKCMPFQDHFDGLGAFDVLEHVPDDQAVLAQFHGALRPGGRLLLTVPQHTWLWSVNDECAHHHRRYGKAQLCSRLGEAGFQILKTTSFVSLLLPLLYFSRKRRDARGTFDLLEEFRIPRWKQWILERILGVEHLFIRLGLAWPVGGSLLVVAEKPGVQASAAVLSPPNPMTEA